MRTSKYSYSNYVYYLAWKSESQVYRLSPCADDESRRMYKFENGKWVYKEKCSKRLWKQLVKHRTCITPKQFEAIKLEQQMEKHLN